jgi:hypothetical protein
VHRVAAAATGPVDHGDLETSEDRVVHVHVPA